MPEQALLKIKRLSIVLLLAISILPGFVLLQSGKTVRLPLSPAEPTLRFLWDGESPSFNSLDGVTAAASQSDHAVMEEILVQAMARWNEVPGSYLRFALELSSEASLNKHDRRFSIALSGEEYPNTGSLAIPEIEGTEIVDCDIGISSKSVSAKTLAYNLLHALGHCLGLGHNQSNYQAVMGFARQDQSLKLGADDQAGVIYLYPEPAFAGPTQEQVRCSGLAITSPQQGAAVALLLLWLPLGLALLCGWVFRLKAADQAVAC